MKYVAVMLNSCGDPLQINMIYVRTAQSLSHSTGHSNSFHFLYEEHKHYFSQNIVHKKDHFCSAKAKRTQHWFSITSMVNKLKTEMF